MWISKSWAALGGGKVVDIRRVYDVHRMSRYLAKYLTKDVILSAPRGVRRWTTSRGIQLFTKHKSTGEWEYPASFSCAGSSPWRFSIFRTSSNRRAKKS